MGDNMLSTPQKVLRETLRARMSTSTFDLNKESEGKDIYEDTEPDDDDDDNATELDEPEEEVDEGPRGRQMSILTEEEKREIRRIRGRESYARRKEASATLGSASKAQARNGDAALDTLESVAGNEQSTSQLGPGPYRKKRKSDVDHAYRPASSDSESDDEETGASKRAKRKMSNRRLTSTGTGEARASEDFPTPPKKQRMQSCDSADTRSTVVSKFIEGSMRDRTSAVPPKDIIGLLPSSSPNRHEDETAYEPAQRQSTDSTEDATMNSANSSLLGSIGTAAGALNPFKFAHRIKDIWEKQKAEYIAHERKKRMMADRRKRSEKAYEEMKRLGAAQGLTGNAAAVAGANQIKFKYQDYAMAGMDGNHEGIGMALSTDSGDEASVGDDAVGAGGRKRISEVTNSIGSEMAISIAQINNGNERNESEAREDHSVRSSLSDYSRASSTFARASDRRSASINGRNSRHSRTSSLVLSPPIVEGAANKLSGVGTLVKKKSKVFVNSIIGKEDKKGDSASKAERGPTKRELKQEERLRNRVSNLEEELKKAKRDLAIVTRKTSGVPPVPQIPTHIANSTVRAVTTTDPEIPQQLQHRSRRSNDSAINRLDVTEGEETEVDEDNDQVDGSFSTVPFSPAMNTSFGGSFNATAMAGMTIIESLGEANHTTTAGNARRPYTRGRSGLRALPKRASTPILGNLTGGRSNGASGRGGGSGSSSGAKGARHSPPPPVSDHARVPPVPRLSRRASGL
ncbi:hypothetical protein L873DRAFT_1762343 [Choiromyces venosus 120613-1]|uniref:Uncharacterized protein n=1 Tax=Choiromyces venosus 120613-1 TaxID=1336337 RepID=A0A3N4JWC9_9PEZI|nr:hypothetical protein L873DRAFT_1762343 [Choiromyces venosus 120613-1]